MNNSIDKAKLDIINFFFETKDSVKKINKQQRDDLLVFIFTLIKCNPSKEAINKMLTILYRVCFLDDVTFEEVWEIYWNLTFNLFTYDGSEIIGGNLRTLYIYIYESVSQVIPNVYKYQAYKDRNLDTIVIVCSQMLGLGHAPTIRVLDYAYTMKCKLGKKVIIINDGGTNFISNDNLGTSIKFGYADMLDNVSSISYKEESFRYIQNSVQMPNVSAMIELVDLIYEINPLLVYNIGADSLVSDYCKEFTTTVSMPCSNEIPISCSKYLLVGRKIDSNDAETLKQLLGYQSVIETNINYEYPIRDERYSRLQFDIPENKFLIGIIGSRLDLEVTEEFITILNKILFKLPQCSIALIGDIKKPERILNLIDDKEKIHIIGELEEAGEFIKFCNLYLNPKRRGGGRSSFEALYWGVPVITLQYGDVYNTCGKEFSVTNYQEMIKLVEKYYKDMEFTENMKKLAKEKADTLSDIKGTLSDVINNIMKKEAEMDKIS